MARLDLETGLLVLIGIFSGVFFVGSFSLPSVPAQLPRMVSAAVLGLCAYVVLGRIFGRGAARDQAETTASSGSKQWIGFTVLTILYWLGMEAVGFTISTLVFAILSPLLLGVRRLRFALAFGVALALSLTAAMRWLFQLPMPEGALLSWLGGR